MQEELDAMGLDIELLAINKTDAESGTALFSEDMVLPMVQDSDDAGVWTAWDATWRDVYVVDSDNVHVGTFNLTGHSLAEEEHYTALLDMLTSAAE